MHTIRSLQDGFRFFILALFLIFLNGCSSDKEPIKPETREVKIAVLLPLTGTYAQIGEHYLKAIELSLFDFADANLKAQILDTKGTFEGTLEALKHVKEADVLLGPVMSTGVDAAAIWALKRKVPVISLTNNFMKAQSGVFVFGVPPQTEAEEMVRYAVKKGMDRFTVILPSGSFGRLMQEAIHKSIKRYGAKLVDVFFYSTNMEELPSIVKQMQKKTVDGIFVVNGGQDLFNISKALEEAKISGRILGTQQWRASDVSKWPQLNGAWYTTGYSAQKPGFEKRYMSVYNKEPDTTAYLAYDAMAMLAKLHKINPYTPFSINALTNPQGFIGLQGAFTLHKNGSIKRHISIMEVKDGIVRFIGTSEEK